MLEFREEHSQLRRPRSCCGRESARKYAPAVGRVGRSTPAAQGLRLQCVTTFWLRLNAVQVPWRVGGALRVCYSFGFGG